jgi:hypothetical protein
MIAIAAAEELRSLTLGSSLALAILLRARERRGIRASACCRSQRARASARGTQTSSH